MTRFASALSRGRTREEGPSEMRTTPGRPTIRHTRSCSRVTATGSSGMIHPRLICWSTALEDPGVSSICEYRARGTRKDRIAMSVVNAARRPTNSHAIQFRWRRAAMMRNRPITEMAAPTRTHGIQG